MSFASRTFGAVGKLVMVAAMLGAFLAGLAGVVYMSLSGEEIRVPEITGKDFLESERELASLGLKIKRRADRPSSEKVNTVLEQLPKAGESVKTGQMIYVVVSRAGLAGEETPSPLTKDLNADDSEKIEEMISEKPKRSKSNANANAKKKPDTTRDTSADNSDSNSSANDTSPPKADGPDKKEPAADPGEKKDKEPATGKGPAPATSRPAAGDKKPKNPTRP
jgi:serine/threonine-protein kinase